MANKQNSPKPRKPAEFDDSALLSLSKSERKLLNMDSWEPSLLRQLLTAQNRLKKRK